MKDANTVKINAPSAVHTNKPQGGRAPETDYQRAQRLVAQHKLNKAKQGDSNPLSSISQLAAKISGCDAQTKALREKRQALIDSKLYSDTGIQQQLAEDKAEAKAAVEAVKLELTDKQAELFKAATDAGEAAAPVFDEGAARTLRLYNELPEPQKRKAKQEAIAGKHPSLAAALISAPSFAVDLTDETRSIMSRRLETPESAAKKQQVMDAANEYKQTTAIVDAILADIAAV